MFEQQIAREAPYTLKQGGKKGTIPAPHEPVLAIKNIQGNIIGFNKDHQTMLFLKIIDLEQFRNWLGRFIPFIATAAEVLQFNQLFKAIRHRRRVETHTVQATWINIAFSFRALEALTAEPAALRDHAGRFADYSREGLTDGDFRAEKFADEAFKQGMPARAVNVLGDPKNEEAEGNPNKWVFGGPGHEPDVVIVVASDSDGELHDEVARIEESIYSGRAITGEYARSGVHIVYKQQGATLPPPLTGHEHFGFLDGVSQPGLRGRISDDPTDVLTPRQNPDNLDQGKPGQDLLWPGEFIFGYQRQSPAPKPGQEDELNTEPGPSADDGPVWAKDGSFFVVRRLRQEVAAFHKFLEATSEQLGLARDHFGAKLVGRWPGGAPIMREPQQDNPRLGNDDCANNHFEFRDASHPIQPHPEDPTYCADDTFPQSPGDEQGAICPFASHIRKTYPRDDNGTLSGGINETTTQTHRLLRRGMPFGDPYYPPPDPDKKKDIGNRGLVFAAYMTSITNQFEFVTRNWANNLEFKDSSEGGELRSGHDLIIGQSNNDDGSRKRRFVLPSKDHEGNIQRVEVMAEEDWVIPTGGGYFFAPSIDALCLLSGTERDGD